VFVLGSTVVIGYGNTLRGDDAVGVKIAEVASSWNLDSVAVLIVQQLTPELAQPLSQYTRGLFVDASIQVKEGARLEPLLPLVSKQSFTHSCEPAGLVSMSQLLYGRSPEAWLLKVAVADFSLGSPLSPVAKLGKASALKILRAFLENA
jgi:hydrogenase maturation protease